MKKIFLIRHGETHWNVQERFQGHLDVPLNENGRNQAKGLIPFFQRNRIEAILSSDLVRALETGKIIANALSLPVFQDPGLREAHMGAAQGMTRDELENEFGLHILHQWRSSKMTDADVSFPGGESGRQIKVRAFQAMEKFLKQSPFSQIGVTTHGGVIRRVMHHLLPEGVPDIPIPNGVVYEIHYREEGNQFSLPPSSEID